MSHDAPARVGVAAAPGAGADHRSRVVRLESSPFLRPRVLASGRSRARVALVAACATLLAGDHLRLEIDIGPNAHLELVEPAGTVAYNAQGGAARWSAAIRIGGGGSLVWPGAPFVVAYGADVHRDTTIELDPGATMLLRETLVLGRGGEEAGRLRATLTATCGGRPLHVEDLDLRGPKSHPAPGILGTGRVLATATLLGTRPDGQSDPHGPGLADPHGPGLADPHETLLAGPGALRREIATEAHLADASLAATWARWRRRVGT